MCVNNTFEITTLYDEHNLFQVGEQFLYHWKTFPIILPSPVNALDPNGGPLSSAEIPFITGTILQ